MIGINSAIASSTGFYAGYGFAIPVTLAKQVMDDLIRYGKVRRAVIGVAIANATAVDAKAAGMKEVTGVLRAARSARRRTARRRTPASSRATSSSRPTASRPTA